MNYGDAVVIDGGEIKLENRIDGGEIGAIYKSEDVEVVPLNVTENGTYQQAGIAYSPVTVDVAGLVPVGTLNITENGEYDVTEYAGVDVDVPLPSGSITITENGTHDVYGFAEAVVNVGAAVEPYEIGADEIVTVSITKTEKRVLPTGYTQVEYIESHGTEYIDTGVTAFYPIRAWAKMEWVQVPLDGDFLGARDATNRLYLFHSYGGWCLGFGHYYSSNIIPAANKLYEVEMIIQSGYQALYVDGANQRQWGYSASFSLAHNFYLFAMNYNGAMASPVKARAYALKIRNGASAASPLVLDLVPCREESTGKFGMYDLVSNTFKGNQGTGDFTGGADVQNYKVSLDGFTTAEEELIEGNLGLIFVT